MTERSVVTSGGRSGVLFRAGIGRERVERVMELSATKVGDVSVVTATGELDLSTADELRECLFGVVAGGARRIVLDLSAVTFLDSTTLGVLVSTRNRLKPADGRLELVCQHPMVLKVLRTTAFDRLFAVHANLADAGIR